MNKDSTIFTQVSLHKNKTGQMTKADVSLIKRLLVTSGYCQKNIHTGHWSVIILIKQAAIQN